VWDLWTIADLLYCYATLPAPDDVVPQQQTLQVGQHVIWQQDIMVCSIPGRWIPPLASPQQLMHHPTTDASWAESPPQANPTLFHFGIDSRLQKKMHQKTHPANQILGLARRAGGSVLPISMRANVGTRDRIRLTNELDSLRH
jgi:hypothetical protein